MGSDEADRLTDLAVEYGVLRRAVGKCNSTCAARRCLQALHVGNLDRALTYAVLASQRNPCWSAWTVAVREAVAAMRPPVPPRAR